MQPPAKPTEARRPRGSHTPPPPRRQPESPRPASRAPPFTTTQFHVLLNSLFKVLFNFPSRYLFAIGLGVIFSLTWSLPRTLSCTPKQLDSRGKPAQRVDRLTGLSPSVGRGPSQGGLGLDNASRGGSPKHHIPRDRGGRRFGAGLRPFHSPLLRASQLFSFPPLINMLKFGGSPCLLSGRSKNLGAQRRRVEEPSATHVAQDGSEDPGEYPKSQRGSSRTKTRSKLEATLGLPRETGARAQCREPEFAEGCKTDPEPDMDSGRAGVRNMRSKCRCSYVLQFTFRRAVCCVLHRPPSQVIHCAVLSLLTKSHCRHEDELANNQTADTFFHHGEEQSLREPGREAKAL